MAKITKIKIGTGEAKNLGDAEAVYSINGYAKADIEGTGENPQYFANKKITESEITALFSSTNKEGNR